MLAHRATKTSLACLMMTAFSGYSLAEEKPLSFQFNQTLLQWASVTAKHEPNGGSSTTAKSSTLDTIKPDAMEVVAHYQQMTLHFWPAHPAAGFKAGYKPSPVMEAGLIVKLNNYDLDKPKTSNSKSVYGLYGKYKVPVGAQSLEINVDLAATRDYSSTPSSTAGSDVKNTVTGTKFGIGFDYVHPIAGGLNYLASVGYSVDSSKADEAKTKDTNTRLAISPLGVRILM